MSNPILNPAGCQKLLGAMCEADRVYLDAQVGLLSVEHAGAISWDELQAIKSHVWGVEAAAIEIYPPRSRVVNNLPMRHLWLLGEGDWWPDLGREGAPELTTLRERFSAAFPVEEPRG